MSTTPSPKRAALYVRVSTDEQTTANQEQALRKLAASAGWEVTRVYRDHAVSGSKARDQRPGLATLAKDATRREFDIVMAWFVDRLGRSLQDLVGFLGELHEMKIDLFLHQHAIYTSTPAGKAMFQMMGVFAEFERAMIRDRVNAGLARARAEGKPLGRPKIDRRTEIAIANALTKGEKGMRKIAAEFGVGVGTVQRIKRDQTANAA